MAAAAPRPRPRGSLAALAVASQKRAAEGGRSRGWSRADMDIPAIERLSQKLLEANLDDDDDDDDDEEGVAFSGYLVKRSGPLKGVRKRFFVLEAGTLSWHKSESDLSSPLGHVTLSECTLADPAAGSKSFIVGTPAKNYDLEADDAEVCLKWVAALRRAAAKPPAKGYDTPGKGAADPSDAGESSDGRGKKAGMVANMRLRAEKKMASRAITSDHGKKLLQQFCAPETFVLLSAVQEVSMIDPSLGCKVHIENTVLRLATKVGLLFQHGRMQLMDFHSIVLASDHLCIDMVRKHNAMSGAGTDAADPDHAGMVRRIKEIESSLVSALGPHIQPKNMQALKAVIAFFGTPERIHRLLVEAQFKEQVDIIAGALKAVYRL